VTEKKLTTDSDAWRTFVMMTEISNPEKPIPISNISDSLIKEVVTKRDGGAVQWSKARAQRGGRPIANRVEQCSKFPHLFALGSNQLVEILREKMRDRD
jgi:hypothetical protein